MGFYLSHDVIFDWRAIFNS